jgi:hypothetical protein
LQVRLKDAVPFPTKDVLYLNDQLIRFQLGCPRQPSKYQRFFMGEYSSPDEVFPEAPNRKAVEHNLASLAKTLDAALALTREWPFDEGGCVMSRQDLLSFNIDHFCRPTYLYTNGQAIVSLVQRNPARFEVVYHPSLRYFNEFDSEFGGLLGDLISAEHVAFASSYGDAEQVAQERLSTVKTWKLRLRKGVELDELVLQPAGSRTVAHGYALETLIASFRADRFRVQMGGPPCGAHEPYRVLNELRPEGFIIEACATFRYFRFTGMSRDMSAGSAGYCTHPSQNNTARGFSAIVSVRHSCPEYTFVADRE